MRAHGPRSDPPSSAGPDRSRLARGRWGEDLAARHYRQLGGEILDRNWRCVHGELDLVVRVGSTIVFSEVKARRTDRYGPAAAAVGPAKQHRIRRLAADWLAEHPISRTGIRFDVVAITGTRLELYDDAF